MASLTGKVAWVTGAGSGIGQAAAIALAQGGRDGRADRPPQGAARGDRGHDQGGGGKAVVQAGDLMKASVGARASPRRSTRSSAAATSW